MGAAVKLGPEPSCLGCGTADVELIDGYCDETQECHAAGVEIERRRGWAKRDRELAMKACAERMWSDGCVCNQHVGV